ncbi:MAG: GNAT family N-acetyltransferase [Gammaproteobacteria bacterium]
MVEYKFFKNTIIPRSAYIKNRLFNAFKDKNEIILNYYRGAQPRSATFQEDSFLIEPSESLYNQIQKLPLFELFRFDWYSSQKYLLRHQQLSRYFKTLTLCSLFFDLKGALTFEIDIPSRVLTISLLEVGLKNQKNGYGEMLLHASILVGVLFGCHLVHLDSTIESIDFYKKQGFFINGSLKKSTLQPMVMNLSNPNSLDKIQSRIKINCPTLDLSEELTIALEKIGNFSAVVKDKILFAPQEAANLKVPLHMIQQPIFTPQLDLLASFAEVEMNLLESELEDENPLEKEPRKKRALPPHEELPAKKRKQ